MSQSFLTCRWPRDSTRSLTYLWVKRFDLVCSSGWQSRVLWTRQLHKRYQTNPPPFEGRQRRWRWMACGSWNDDVLLYLNSLRSRYGCSSLAFCFLFLRYNCNRTSKAIKTITTTITTTIQVVCDLETVLLLFVLPDFRLETPVACAKLTRVLKLASLAREGIDIVRLGTGWRNQWFRL